MKHFSYASPARGTTVAVKAQTWVYWLPRGRSMDDNFKLNSRARDWIRGIQKHYAGKPIVTTAHEAVPEPGSFKILLKMRLRICPIEVDFHTLIEDSPAHTAGPVRTPVAGLPRSVVPARVGVVDRPGYLESRRACARASARAGTGLGATGRTGRRWRRGVAFPVVVVSAAIHCRLLAGCLGRPAGRRGTDTAAQLRFCTRPARGQLAGNTLDRSTGRCVGRLHLGGTRWHERGRSRSLLCHLADAPSRGTGFGIPLVVRYVLEVAQDTAVPPRCSNACR